MAVARFQFKPTGTKWIGVEIIVTYLCHSDPKVERVKITGLKQFGLILSHEYDIDALVNSARRIPCDVGGDCQESIKYEFDVTAFVADVVGFGIGIGKLGTGTAGWSTQSTEETFVFGTACLCCDAERVADRSVMDVKVAPTQANAIPWLVGFAGIGTAVALAGLNFDHPSLVPKIVIYGTASGMVASLGVAVARLAQFFRRKVQKLSNVSLDVH